MRLAALAFCALLAALAAADRATAQYPLPVGSLTAVSSETATTTGTSVRVSCTARDRAGVPIGGQTITFAIVPPPGSGAYLSNASAMTDAGGVGRTTLFVGSDAGTIAVTCGSGDLSSQVVVEVLGARSAALPPQAGIQPPSTGDGGLRQERAPTAPVALALALVLLASARLAFRGR